jgi:dipeptidyl-peptidase-4
MVLLLYLFFAYSFVVAQVELNDILNTNKYKQKTFGDVTPSSDGAYFFSHKNNFIIKYSFVTGKPVDTLINTVDKEFSDIPEIEEFSFDRQVKVFLLATSKVQLYRYSYFATYYLYNVASRKVSPVANKQPIRGACLAPDGTVVAYVLDNNIFLQNIANGITTQITFDGIKNKILNGLPDWVYEEEFTQKKGIFWSYDNQYLAYYKIDESAVNSYPLIFYKSNNYPEVKYYKYPRPGEKIASAKVMVYNLLNKQTIEMDTHLNEDHYLPRVYWSGQPEKLAILRTNRLQNKQQLIMASANDGQSSVFYSDSAATYFDEPEENHITFINSKNDYLLLSEKSGFRHIWFHSFDGKTNYPITSGPWEVTSLLGYDSNSKTIYYTSNESSPSQEAIYSVAINGRKPKQLILASGVNQPIFSSDYAYFFNFNYQFAKLNTEAIYKQNGEKVIEMSNNNDLKIELHKNNVHSRRLFSFYTHDSTRLYGWYIKPANFDSTKKYPALLFIYGGPGVQTVTESSEIKWYHYLANQGYVLVSVDNRGTSGRGVLFRTATLKNFGEVEVADQVEAVKYFGKLGFIDTTRVGVFGWSFGGYLSAMCLIKGQQTFKLAVSVAPPTDWRMYDATYTERYMGLPSDNLIGYLRSSLVENAKLMNGKLLLIHGTADENVQLQHTLLFSDALVKANKQFEMQIYTDKNHRINGGNTNLQLYNRICDFIMKNL